MTKVKFNWARLFKIKDKPRNIFTIYMPPAEGNKFDWSTKKMKR